MSLFSPIYVTPLFSCSPLKCLRKYRVLPESDIATESRGVHVSVCTSCNPLTGFKQTELRPALQSLGRCQVFPVNDSQLLVVTHPVAERGFCCHLAQKRLWRDGAEPGSRVLSSWKYLLVLPVVKWCTQSWGKAATGLGVTRGRPFDLMFCGSGSVWTSELLLMCSWKCLSHNEVGFPIFTTTVTHVRVAPLFPSHFSTQTSQETTDFGKILPF